MLIKHSILYLFSLSIILTSTSCATNTPLVRSNYPYAPPFEKGKRFLISQAFNGIHTHRDLENKYAVDIVMPIGTPVCAARSGILTNLVDSNIGKGSTVKELISNVNYVKILHEDKTSSVYAHLKKASVTATIGQKIKKGQCFAKSGNSGYSTGPHLHFSVLINHGKTERSIPFAFFSSEGKYIHPQYLVWVYN